ncbi:MAG: PaaI family thioesterase [Chloroflexi bacterium]|nr:PaaI family thioesterase [Chloroflexota bacterium]
MTPRIQVGQARHHCFGCGTENPIGLRLRFSETAEGATAEFVACPEHQGWDGIVHGGIILTLLDEALSWAVLYKCGVAVTAEIQARLRRPAPIGIPLRLEATVRAQRRTIVDCQAAIRDPDGHLLADAHARFVVVGEQP